jgi:hypothetical protein
LFRYDAHDRLTDYIGVYSAGNGGYEFWHHFVHDNKGRIVRDTTFTFGRMAGGNPVRGFVERVTTYKYDTQNRIIEEDGLSPFSGNTYQYLYVYNSQGNLERDYGHYDDKINIHRTHPIWQFIDRDFSQNNFIPGFLTAITYNAYGLPVQFDTDPKAFSAIFIYINYNHLEVAYQCW